MFSRRFVSVLFAVASYCIGASAKCTNPAVRKEWRTLSAEQRADWIAAVNVGGQSFVFDCWNSISFELHQCLAKLPHDEALTPFVNPDDIVAINTSSSYYDGKNVYPSILIRCSTFVFLDIVYIHMDLNHIVLDFLWTDRLFC